MGDADFSKFVKEKLLGDECFAALANKLDVVVLVVAYATKDAIVGNALRALDTLASGCMVIAANPVCLSRSENTDTER